MSALGQNAKLLYSPSATEQQTFQRRVFPRYRAGRLLPGCIGTVGTILSRIPCNFDRPSPTEEPVISYGIGSLSIAAGLMAVAYSAYLLPDYF
jgi:hypothetical protein